MRAATFRKYDDIEAILAKKSVSTWLESLAEGQSRRNATYNIARYLRWRRKKGIEPDSDAMIHECMEGTNKTLVEHLKTLLEYLKDGEFRDVSPITVRGHHDSIRSFYRGNLVELPRSKFKARRSQTLEVKAEVTADEYLSMMKRALPVASVRDRSIMLTALQTGCDESTISRVLNFVAFPQLAKHFESKDPRKWDLSKCPVRLLLVRPKTDYSYYTFLDVDAVDALRDYLSTKEPLEIHPSENPQMLERSDPIFTDYVGNPLAPLGISRVFRNAGKRAGVNIPGGDTMDPAQRFRWAKRRYPFHTHECRDVLISLARGCHADLDAANFFVGHVLDPLKYDKSPWNDVDYFRAEYLKIARPNLNPISGKVLEVRDEVRKEYDERLANLERQIASLLSEKTAS